MMKKDDFFFSPRLGGGRGGVLVLFFILFFFLCFCFSHVYSARSMEGGIWERGGLEKEQTRVLDGPLRGSARVGQVEFK